MKKKSSENPLSQKKVEPDNKKAGDVLREYIRVRAAEQNLSMQEVANTVGMSYIYLTSLLSRTRSFHGLNIDLKRAIGKFLGVPLVQVLIMAEELSIEDFVYEMTRDDRLKLSLKKMRLDPAYASISVSDEAWDATPDEVKICVALLYERVCNDKILEKVHPVAAA